MNKKTKKILLISGALVGTFLMLRATSYLITRKWVKGTGFVGIEKYRHGGDDLYVIIPKIF